jgi:hypothetical protein
MRGASIRAMTKGLSVRWMKLGSGQLAPSIRQQAGTRVQHVLRRTTGGLGQSFERGRVDSPLVQ